MIRLPQTLTACLLFLSGCFLHLPVNSQYYAGTWDGKLKVKTPDTLIPMSIRIDSTSKKVTASIRYTIAPDTYLYYQADVEISPDSTLTIRQRKDADSIRPATAKAPDFKMYIFEAKIIPTITEFITARTAATAADANAGEFSIAKQKTTADLLLETYNSGLKEWLEHGKFETQEDYDKRVKQKRECIKDEITTSFYRHLLLIKPMACSYDIDKTEFTLTVDNCIPVTIKVPAKEAECFKEELDNRKALVNHTIHDNGPYEKSTIRYLEIKVNCRKKPYVYGNKPTDPCNN